MKPMKENSVAVCVYCGSGPGQNPAYADAARILGKLLAQSGIGLVYGGGSLGLMGEVAKSAIAHGGDVTGVIPEFLIEREQMLTEVRDLVVTQDMHERKMTMFERSNAFIALPGGMGTLEELVEMSTWAQLGQHRKPIVIVNVEGFWDPFLELVAHMRREGFIRPGLEMRYIVATDPKAALDMIRPSLLRSHKITEPLKSARRTM